MSELETKDGLDGEDKNERYSFSAEVTGEGYYKLLEIKGAWKCYSDQEILVQLLEREYGREKEFSDLKQKLLDRREKLKQDVNEVNKSLESMNIVTKILRFKDYLRLTKKRAKLRGKLKEQMNTYQMVRKYG